MSKNTWLFLLLSAVFGLGAVYLANNWLSDANRSPAVDYKQVVEVAQTVPIGTILEAKQLRLKTYPDSLVPEGAFTSFEAVSGKVAKDTLYAGDIVRAERIAEKGQGSSLASLIDGNKRALTIRVNDVVGVAGFLLPGDKVDVLNTFKQARGKNTVTEVVLANVKILAIDQTAQNNENRPRVVRAVTVEVTLAQAEELMNARSRGNLQLALRNPIDDREVEVAKYSKAPLDEPDPLPTLPEPVALPAAVHIKSKVHLIRGVAEEIISVDNDQAGGNPQ